MRNFASSISNIFIALSTTSSALLRFLRTWMLPIGMVTGALSYFVYRAIPALDDTHAAAMSAISVIQPMLLFAMLFLTFCKVDFHDLRPRRWHVWNLLIQIACYALLSLLLILVPDIPLRPAIEAIMLCLICPTATAGAVVTGKLGGDVGGITTYTILINLAVAIVMPTFIPLTNPHPGLDFSTSFFMIMGKVFPLLICPFIAAQLIRILLPKVHAFCISVKDLAFYIWAVALTLAIAVSVRSLVNSSASTWCLIGIAVGSLASCVMQFALGRKVGRRYDHPISAGQSLGQKNTVFAIWAGYTFYDPVSCIAGGFYSIWHNTWNSIQLARHAKNSR